MLYLNPIEALLNATRKSVHHHLRTGSGVLVIDCKRCSPASGKAGEVEFQVLLHGWPRHFHISSSQLRNYLAQAATRLPADDQTDPFAALEKNLLQVLQEGGFGSVWLEFKSEKKGVVLILEQRLSKRYVFRK